MFNKEELRLRKGVVDKVPYYVKINLSAFAQKTPAVKPGRNMGI